MKAFLAVSALCVVSLSSANLVTNGGFEDGLNGWTLDFDPSKIVLVSDDVNSGSNAAKSLSGDNSDNSYSFGILSQSIAPTLVSDLTEVTAFHKVASDSPSGTGGLGFAVLFSDATLGFYYQGGSSDWMQADFLGNLQTDHMGKTLVGIQVYEGLFGNHNVLIDDVVIESVPEPATMALMGLGLAAMARRRRS